MKKILLTVGTLTAIASPLVAVISCSDELFTFDTQVREEVPKYKKSEVPKDDKELLKAIQNINLLKDRIAEHNKKIPNLEGEKQRKDSQLKNLVDEIHEYTIKYVNNRKGEADNEYDRGAARFKNINKKGEKFIEGGRKVIDRLPIIRFKRKFEEFVEGGNNIDKKNYDFEKFETKKEPKVKDIVKEYKIVQEPKVKDIVKEYKIVQEPKDIVKNFNKFIIIEKDKANYVISLVNSIKKDDKDLIVKKEELKGLHNYVDNYGNLSLNNRNVKAELDHFKKIALAKEKYLEDKIKYLKAKNGWVTLDDLMT